MKKLFIAVHPYNAYGIYERDPSYVWKRDARLLNTGLEQVMLVHKNPAQELQDIDETMKRIHEEKDYWKGRIFFTHSGDHASDQTSGRRISFNALAKHLLEKYKADSHIFWGAELHMPPDSMDEEGIDYWKDRKPYGCVFHYHSVLTLPNRSIEKAYCLRYDY